MADNLLVEHSPQVSENVWTRPTVFGPLSFFSEPLESKPDHNLIVTNS